MPPVKKATTPELLQEQVKGVCRAHQAVPGGHREPRSDCRRI
jgi:hypothetical protein